MQEKGRNAEELRQYVMEKLEHFRHHTKWREMKAPKDVQAWLLEQDVEYPVVRCQVTLHCPATELMRFLVDEITETLPKWSRDIEEIRELERFSEDQRVLVCRTRGMFWPIADRDDVFYVHRGQHAQGTFYEASTVVTHKALPPRPGVVRTHMYFASKEIKPLSSQSCLYDVLWQYDPKGWMAKLWPQRWVIHAVHAHLKDECVRLQKHYNHLTNPLQLSHE